ncbi:hypothetical protein MW887_007019 [Aspergillus wentii]|nr:hypothetical protein MW887_007019 [Aspergillus wentii]
MPMQTVPISLPPPRHEPSVPPAPPVESRKRPHYPDKPILAPRAIQPRPSTASYSSESGASAHLSPGLESVTSRGERPRKRGRPSKAETERRKAVAEARGEMYPPPRRPGAKPKIPSAPTSPVAVESRGVSFSPRTSVQIPEASRHDPRYVPPPPGRAIASLPLSGEDRSREIPDRESGPIFRELPRPTQTLPSPQALHLGPREPIPRIDLGDRRFEPLPPDRAPLTMNRPRAMTDHPRRPDQPPISMPEATMSTPIEKRPG